MVSAALCALLKVIKPSDPESSRIFSGYTTARQENAPEYNQWHTNVIALIESDIDAALDVLLSPSLAGGVYVSHANSPSCVELTGLFTSVMGFYRLIQGLAVNRPICMSSGGLIGVVYGGLRRGYLVVNI